MEGSDSGSEEEGGDWLAVNGGGWNRVVMGY
jgi:hypothetical protein